MKIAGLQKMTLLDYPGKVAATVFLGGCNFRCPYCHNASLIDPGAQTTEIAEEAFFSFLRKRKGWIDGVCVSGGEPLLQAGLPAFLKKIRDLGFLVKLDTNGSYPQKLKRLVNDGLLDYVAMDIKHSPAKYAAAAGITGDILPQVRESVAFLLQSPVECEFRTTVVRGMHTAEDVAEIGQWIEGAEHFILQNFKSSPDVLTPGLQGFETTELKAFADAARPYVPGVQLRSG